MQLSELYVYAEVQSTNDLQRVSR